MLEIKGITKVYNTGGFRQKALSNVSINFRKSEFAAILGPSGSGKTTLLNIIGGLDHYTSGDLIINEISTKKFKDKDWDSYRNHRIGFVFQSYNLINHQTILQNVKLALTLSGISKSEATRRATKALKDVGLEKHLNKKPNQLSGGQMQRVAIARALVNNPEILLADEPTGALDSETSLQIMDLLKEIAKTKLVIMVTHNPDLATSYANRIIELKDGSITSDSRPYDGKINTSEDDKTSKTKLKKTHMSFFTALGLSFKNLLTKKGRTILVAFAGSIGIIGIALILAVSTGFQNYVDTIQEETLTSYPLTINQEATNLSGILLSLTSNSGQSNGSDKVTEEQYITSVLGNISTNDLKNFNRHITSHYSELESDISTIKYSYNIDPPIYTIDAANNLAKLNPSSLFSTIAGGSSSLLSSYSSLTSVYSQMIDNFDTVADQYDVLAGRLPENYNEMLLVLSEPNSISDFLIYSLGLRDTSELTSMVTKIMSGESVEINNEPMTLSYDDLMDTKLKLIEPSDFYQYNSKYDVYEDMSSDDTYMANLYDKAEELHIVGIISPKEGSMSSALSPGVAYTSSLIRHIIDYSSNTSAVKKQLENKDIDVFSGSRFNAKRNGLDLSFSSLVSVDNDKLAQAFNVNINKDAITAETTTYMNDIANNITTDIAPAKTDFVNTFNLLATGLKKAIPVPSVDPDTGEINPGFTAENIPIIVTNYLDSVDSVPDLLKLPYSGLLQSVLAAYLGTAALGYQYDIAVNTVTSQPVFDATATKIASEITEGLMKQSILTKVGELTSNLSAKFANAFSIDKDALLSAFSLNFTEEELTRVVQAMFTKTETTLATNLSALGYQDLEEPTRISFYFTSFDGKERFLDFIKKYNDLMTSYHQDDKVIRYSDVTGVLMDSVKVIVDAVSYVLIAFVSISLVVSSIMIGIITYISVYERTKEIGILRAIGASKHNISSIFNAETFIIGLLSGIFGITTSYLFIPIINAVLHHFTGNIPLSATLAPESAAILIVISIVLTLIGGLIPARSASKKDPVEALRSE